MSVLKNTPQKLESFKVGEQTWPPTTVTISIDGRTNYLVSKATLETPNGNKRSVCHDIVKDFFACEKIQEDKS